MLESNMKINIMATRTVLANNSLGEGDRNQQEFHIPFSCKIHLMISSSVSETGLAVPCARKRFLMAVILCRSLLKSGIRVLDSSSGLMLSCAHASQNMVRYG
jgi:hypothetical protein